MTNAAFNFKGNKNGKGQILGTAFKHGGQALNSMDSFVTSFKGNKNKTGQTLGSSMGTQCHKSTYDDTETVPQSQEHASLTLRGNKYGKGQNWAACCMKIQKRVNS